MLLSAIEQVAVAVAAVENNGPSMCACSCVLIGPRMCVSVTQSIEKIRRVAYSNIVEPARERVGHVTRTGSK